MKRKIDDLGRIVLPAEMKKEIGLENGSEANIELEDHKIIITKPDSIDYKAIVDKALDKLYCWGEILDAKFQQEMLEILKGEK